MNSINYGFKRYVDLTPPEAEAKLRETLKEQGFGVLTEIDVQAVMKKKLDKDVKPYRILGACNPEFAFQALSHEQDVGLLLPCNVTIYETDNGRTVVSAVNPMEAMKPVGNEGLEDVAELVSGRLKRAIETV